MNASSSTPTRRHDRTWPAFYAVMVLGGLVQGVLSAIDFRIGWFGPGFFIGVVLSAAMHAARSLGRIDEQLKR